MQRRCIVIGASAGGFEVVVDIASQLPADLPVPVFLAMHVPAYQPSYLPSILARAGKLQAIHPVDGQKVEPGFIYIAPPDRHLLIDDGHVAVKRGPKENGFRPSIDALFRSAAYSFGPGAIGVVLSGALHDGTSGLWTIKRLGGIAIVQDPYDARYASMPRSALEYVNADYTVKASEISELLIRLANDPVEREGANRKDADKDLEHRIATEVQVAAGTNVSEENILELGELTSFTCPECHGTLIQIKEGAFSRFRCHTGHGFTDDALLDAVTRYTGEKVWQVTRSLQETVMILQHMGKHIQDAGDVEKAGNFFDKARDLEKQASQMQKLATEQERLSQENLEYEKKDEEKQ